MLRYSIFVLISVLLINDVGFTQSITSQETSQTAKVKTEVQRRGTGPKSRVKVTLRNNTEVRGYINRISDSSFELTDRNTGQTTTIAYADTSRVQGNGLSKGAKIAIIAGVGVAILVVVIAAEFKANGY